MKFKPNYVYYCAKNDMIFLCVDIDFSPFLEKSLFLVTDGGEFKYQVRAKNCIQLGEL